MGVEHVVLAAYLACLVAIFVYSLSMAHLGRIVVRARRRPNAPQPRCTPDPQPRVTVQLPIYNELHVAERIIDAAAALDHPREQLRIQVLDDSTDATRGLVDAAVARHAARGVPIDVVRRTVRTGFKAGALAHGLACDTAEYVLVLDADFVPRADLVRLLLAGFDAADVAVVQARWGFLNEPESLMTSVEAFLLGMHFGVEQPGRALSGGMLNFNGTAGMWRRAAIDDAGGWQARTVTEDVDLSYRAQLRGWRIAYLEDVVVDSELPADVGALRTQQHRWIKGGAQNARLHLGAVCRHEAPASVRWHAAMHLVSGSLYAAILAMLILSVPLAAVKNTSITTDYTDWGMPFTAATVALGWVLAVAHRPNGRRGWLRFGVMLPAFLVFTMGLAVHNGSAAISGWAGRGGEFVRTAKAGAGAWPAAAYARRVVDRRVLPELALVAWLLAGLAIGWQRGQTAFAPLQLMALAGLTWVLTLSVRHPWQARQHRRDRPEPFRRNVPQEVAR